MLNKYLKQYVGSIIKTSRSSCTSSETIHQGTVIVFDRISEIVNIQQEKESYECYQRIDIHGKVLCFLP
jgi:hypothetical protein